MLVITAVTDQDGRDEFPLLSWKQETSFPLVGRATINDLLVQMLLESPFQKKVRCRPRTRNHPLGDHKEPRRLLVFPDTRVEFGEWWPRRDGGNACADLWLGFT